jgi:uncharacterized protein YcbK (DUF882 family)
MSGTAMSLRRSRLLLLAGLLVGAAAWWSHARFQAAPDFDAWLAQGSHAGDSARYHRHLGTQGVADVLPLPQLLSVQRDWRRCRSDPWLLPPPSHWPQMVPTLRLLRELQARGLVTAQDVVTSAYRDAALNACAGGSAHSRHLDNSALDLRLTDADPAPRLAALCRFWQREGKKFAFGLGFYAGGQIHIDSSGHRSWGPDYTARSSPCRHDTAAQ